MTLPRAALPVRVRHLGRFLRGAAAPGARRRPDDALGGFVETVGRRQPRRWGVFGRAAAGPPDRRVVPGLYGIRVEERLAAGAYTVRAELPGIDADRDLEVSIADGRLFLLAERRRGPAGAAGAAGGERPRYSEFRYGAFARALRLPPGARGTEATARYENGVVTVTMPCRGREP